MDAWMALVSIISIVAVVLVAAGLIAFIGHMIIGAIDTEKRLDVNANKEVIDYTQYKQIENAKTVEEVDADEAKAKKEFEQANELSDNNFELVDENDEDSLEELEKRLAQNAAVENDSELEEEQPLDQQAEDVAEEELLDNPAEEVVEQQQISTDDDDDLDSLLDEISNDVIEQAKDEAQEENAPKMSDELESYTIDDYLNSSDEEPAAEEETVETDDAEDVEESNEGDQEGENGDGALEVEIDESEDLSDTDNSESSEVVEASDASAEIESLRAQLAELNRQLEEARNTKVEVVTINMTEAECLARLETLEERLKNVRKDYKTNLKEYRPLKKVMTDLERYQTKLRRKEAIVAKKKVALYGVNNYVDIDKEKAEKLANELELLEGLRLSVSHCEEVINANKDRYPILEHTNKILEDEIEHLESDKAATELTLQKIREQNGSSEGANGSQTED